MLKESGVSAYAIKELLKREEQAPLEERKKHTSSFLAFRRNQETSSESASQSKEHQEKDGVLVFSPLC